MDAMVSGDPAGRRRQARRTAWLLVLLAACIYAGFIGYAVLHGHR